MTETIEKLNEGDIFRWNYKKVEQPGEWGSYHCCSRIAVVRNGRLYDTYWAYGLNPPSGSGRSFDVGDLSRIELKFLANETDLKPAKAYEADYYDDADIVDLTHPNGGSFHLRNGAGRSQAKMLLSARRELEKSESAERSAAWRSERLRETIAKIEAGEVQGYI